MSREENIGFLHDLLDFYQSIQEPEVDHPIHLSLIWLRSVNNDIQILLLNHSEKVLIEKINIYEPYHAFKKSTFFELQTDLKKTKVFEAFDAGVDDVNYYLKKLARKNLPYLKKPPKNKFIKDGIFCSGCLYWIFHGNMFSTSFKAIKPYFKVKFEHETRVDDLFELLTKGGDIIEVEKLEDSPFKRIPKDLFLKGDIEREYEMPFLGGFIFPPVWFGDVYIFTHDYENPEELPLNNHVKTVCYSEISDRQIIVKSDGFLGVSINNNVDGISEFAEEEETRRFINFFLGIFHLINDIIVHSTLESEFFYTYYFPKKDLFDSDLKDGFKGYSSRTHDLFNERQKPVHIHSSIKRRIIPLINLRLVFKDLEIVVNDEKLSSSLNLLIDAHTNLVLFKLNESFILSWVIIEQYLNYSWNEFFPFKKT